ncbi:MAG TPA: FtsX-like permease family protein [Thermoanaerobaculia bacterium]|jgi:putative ABC transport system permease protein|nr:FtsX-like permease family protein [Thermoanaerobaculia bacterium]
MITRALVLRPLVHEKLRTALTVLGIAVGVAVIVAIQLANRSALRAFRESVDAVAGRANYQIVGESGTLDENLLLNLRWLWPRGGRFAPVIDVEGVLEPSQLPIRLLAVDLLSDLHFREYRYATVLTSNAARIGGATQYLDLFHHDSVILPAPFAREHGITIGDPISLSFGGKRSRMVVRGILEARGPATAFNGSIAICDIAAAQASFGLRGVLTRIDLLISDNLLSTLAKQLPPGVRIERPSRRNERVEKMLRAFRVNLYALAGVALLVGMFLVYNTVLISILRRRRDVGVLKTLGVSPSQVFAAFIGEGLLFGIIGSLIGIALGNFIASAILTLVGRTINALYITSQPQAVALTPVVLATGVTVGVVLSLVSAVQPAIEAAQVRPNTMIRPGLQQRIRSTRGLIVAAIVCFVAAALASRVPPLKGIAIGGYIAVVFVVTGFSLLAPSVLRRTSSALQPMLTHAFGIVGRLAAASLPASLRRTSVASAALSLATGMMVAVALMVGSFRETVRIWVNQTVQSDLWLRPSKGLSNADAALFPAAIGDEVRSLPFVQAIDRVRGRDMLYGDAIIAVGSGDFEIAAGDDSLPMVKRRSASDALREAIRRDGVLVSESFALKFHKDVGDIVRLPIVGGTRDFPVTGVYRDYSNDRGVVAMNRPLYVRSFHDDAINTVVVFLKPGVDREQARIQLEKIFGPKYHAFAVSNASIRKEVMTIFDQTFMITYALLGVAIVVAVLGIVNTLAALILERTRELALLRVSGMSRRQLATMLVLESSLIGLASTGVGIVMGYVLSIVLIYVINKQSFGWTIEFHTPAALIAASLGITFLASVVAGFVPARLANRIDVVTAIKSE